MSTNARFVPTNLGDSATTLTATSTAGSLAAANMQLDERAAVWRSTGLSAQTLDMRWTVAQSIDSICGAWSNFSSGCTIQCQGFANVGDVSTLFDQTVSPDTALSINNTTFQNWIPTAQNIKQLKVIITDAGNSAGYVQLSRLIVGKRIEPLVNASQGGFSVGFIEQGMPHRTESRDLRMESLGRYRTLKIRLDRLEAASRDLFIGMISNGLGKGVWVSVFPEDSNASNKQLHAFWGALTENAQFTYPFLDTWAVPLVFEEMG